MKCICLQIGPDYNKTTAGLQHPNCNEECPDQCTNQWKYSDNGWHFDGSIEILCGTIFRCHIDFESF